MAKLVVGKQEFKLDKKQEVQEKAIASFEYKEVDGSPRTFKDVDIKGAKITADNKLILNIMEDGKFKALRVDRIVSPKVEVL